MTSVFVGNLSYQTTENQLGELFSQIGRVNNVRVVNDRETGRPKGFAFVEFADQGSAERAIREMDNRDLNGRNMRVNMANQRN